MYRVYILHIYDTYLFYYLRICIFSYYYMSFGKMNNDNDTSTLECVFVHNAKEMHDVLIK